ncbi:MAG: flagellar biosynthetic protein FliQ [Eubacteriales bacterium]
MSQGDLMGIIKDAVTTALIIAAPFLIVTAGIGLVVAVVQAATQIQEQSIAFIVKIVAVGLILILLGSWLITGMLDFTLRIFKSIDSIP